MSQHRPQGSEGPDMPARFFSSEEKEQGRQRWDLKLQFGALGPLCSLPFALDREFWRRSPTQKGKPLSMVYLSALDSSLEGLPYPPGEGSLSRAE